MTPETKRKGNALPPCLRNPTVRITFLSTFLLSLPESEIEVEIETVRQIYLEKKEGADGRGSSGDS